MGNRNGRRGDMEEQLAQPEHPSGAANLDDKKYICKPGQVSSHLMLIASGVSVRYL